MKSQYLSIPLLLLGVIGLAVIFERLTEPRVGHPSAESGSATLTSPAPTAPRPQAIAHQDTPEPATIAFSNSATRLALTGNVNTEDSPPDLESAYVQKRTQELQDLAMDNDPDSLKTIMSELSNPDPKIRKAALDATIQFASRDAIPGLREVAARTADPKEKGALEDAIEYLQLPSLTEVMQEQGRTRSARVAPMQGAVTPARPPAHPVRD
jgi:hypothetical protein